MASYAGAKRAIRERLKENWAQTPISVSNKAPSATSWPPLDAQGFPSPWVALEIMGTGSEMYGAGVPGKSTWLYLGLIHAHVFVPTDVGDDAATEMAVAIGEIYRGDIFYREAPGCYVRTWAPWVDDGDPSDAEGNWYRVTMTCPFEYWHRG